MYELVMLRCNLGWRREPRHILYDLFAATCFLCSFVEYNALSLLCQRNATKFYFS